jgi:hypothetical protein
MHASERKIRRGASLVAALVVFLAPRTDAAHAEADSALASVRLRHPKDRVLVVEAIRGAARRLGYPRCQALFTTFTDRKGRPLREALDSEGLAPVDQLGRIFFYDGSASGCASRQLAYTEPGSHVVFVCGDRFRSLAQQNPTYLEAAIIHESLHTLGLGENPPSWEEITARVLEACRQ